MKDADGPMWKIVDEGVRMALGLDQGSTEAAIEHRLGDLQTERSKLSDQLESIQSRLEQVESMEEDLESRLSRIREKKQSHRDRLDEILESMEEDTRSRPVTAWMSDIKEASLYEYGNESKDNIDRVIGDLRQRATEEGYSISPDRFSRTVAANSNLQSSADGGEDEDFRVLKGGDDDE
jgi:DNA repair exonuclease SbcCD ATPase subunit